MFVTTDAKKTIHGLDGGRDATMGFCYHVPAMDKPRCLIVRTAGTNCDMELAHAFELAGASTKKLHINELIANPAVIEQFELIGFPGRFQLR